MLRFVSEYTERTRINMLVNDITYDKSTLYQMLTKTFEVIGEEFITVVVSTSRTKNSAF